MEPEKIDVIDENIAKLEAFAKMLKDFNALWDSSAKEQSNCDCEICDLLHEIENSPLSIFDDYKICRDLRDARRRRRHAKNILLALEPFKKYYDTHRNLEMDLFKVCREVKRLRKGQIDWTYRPRIREDLKVSRVYREAKALKEQKPSA